MKLKFKIKEKEYDVEVLENKEGGVKIKVGEKEFVFREREKEEKGISISQISFPKRDFSKKEIKAPITGIISEIFVKEGEFLKEGKKIFLLSAMKMENEIVSEFEGRVKRILVKKEQKVKVGDTLMVLE